jgi:hypothetical protein
MLATSVVSARPRLTTARIARGTVKSPTTTSPTRNAASRPVVSAIAPAERPLPVPTAVSTARSSTAIRSSTIRMPTTRSRMRPRTPCSSNAFAMIVVDEIASIEPENRHSTVVQPNARPIVKPSHIIRLACTSDVIPAVGASSTSFDSRNSSPSANMSRMTPSSDSEWITVGSANSGNATCGPTSTPATR